MKKTILIELYAFFGQSYILSRIDRREMPEDETEWWQCVHTPYKTHCRQIDDKESGQEPPSNDSGPGTSDPRGEDSQNPSRQGSGGSSSGGGVPSSPQKPTPYQRSETKQELQRAYLLSKGFGRAGDYQIKSSIHIVETAKGTYLVSVSALGKTSAPIGKVHFTGDVSIRLHGTTTMTQSLRQTGLSYYESGYHVIRNATFEVNHQVASIGKIVIEAGYRHLESGTLPIPSRTSIEFNIHK